jgi:hypothetical protein
LLIGSILVYLEKKGCPYECIQEMHFRYDKDGFVDEPRRIRAHKMIEIGDVAYLLKRGNGKKEFLV